MHYYYEFSDWVLPPDVGANRPYKILMDQSIYACAKYAAYIGARARLDGARGADAADAVKRKLWPALTTGWRFWPLAHVITYTVVPPRHRVLLVNLDGPRVDHDPLDTRERARRRRARGRCGAGARERVADGGAADAVTAMDGGTADTADAATTAAARASARLRWRLTTRAAAAFADVRRGGTLAAMPTTSEKTTRASAMSPSTRDETTAAFSPRARKCAAASHLRALEHAHPCVHTNPVPLGERGRA